MSAADRAEYVANQKAAAPAPTYNASEEGAVHSNLLDHLAELDTPLGAVAHALARVEEST